MKPSLVLLTMHIPPEEKHQRYDDAFATGFAVANGAWGTDILTVAHGVEGAWDLHATYDTSKKVPAEVIARDKNLDVALVRVKAHIPVVALGTSDGLEQEVGREVGVLGYPIPDEFQDEDLGPGTSVVSGRLSSLRKDAIEVTLPIVPGESGGPVFLADTGEIIGLAESRFEDEPSIGFALPIDDAKSFLHRTDAVHGF